MHATSDATTDAKIARLSTHQRDDQREMWGVVPLLQGQILLVTRKTGATRDKCVTPYCWYVLEMIKSCAR